MNYEFIVINSFNEVDLSNDFDSNLNPKIYRFDVAYATWFIVENWQIESKSVWLI